MEVYWSSLRFAAALDLLPTLQLHTSRTGQLQNSSNSFTIITSLSALQSAKSRYSIFTLPLSNQVSVAPTMMSVLIAASQDLPAIQLSLLTDTTAADILGYVTMLL